ncbi:metal-sulfur cluster assembly factor [Microaerobacter geothermalis]|uniref:metal-sulfur cluster assembly factor n=1 Tax=Microaerobacter geothermalis TaxID=674972 RepID=UPI001F4471DC|nr:metal-sulfur cluster assembly factor [Microaerobacter geothermalis]MCF6092444.1 metal-sulfur cluster assembly factor [Microaerobacter geothermalis]
MVTEEMVREKLYDVYDPELGINVVDLGLIYGIDLVEDGKSVNITMTLTTPGCPLHDSISRGVQNAVQQIPGVELVHVDLVWSPPWTPERMSEKAKQQLQGW